MPTAKTWFLIADAGRARILERAGKAGRLSEVDGTRLEEHVPPTHEIVADRQGRTMSSVGDVRHAYEPRSDPHREQKRRFAVRLADMLAERLAASAFERLVLVAAPQALGDLREALAPAVAAKVVAELDKDLTKIPDSEIAGHLDQLKY